MKQLKQSDYKSGMKVLFDYQGQTHKGTVEVEGKRIFICQDVLNGCDTRNKHRHTYSYALCESDGTQFLYSHRYELINIRPDPEAETVAPVKKYSFVTCFILNGEEFDIEAHREKISRLSDELKEAKAVERAFVKYKKGEGR